MRSSFRSPVGSSAVWLLLVAGWMVPFAQTAGADDQPTYMMEEADADEGRWFNFDLADPVVYEKTDEEAPWMTLRIGALILHRSSTSTEPLLTDPVTGNTLLTAPEPDPWAAGTEVDFMLYFTDTTAFEFNWFSVDDWFAQNVVPLGGTTPNEVPSSLASASSSVSSRIRNYEFNLREEFYDGLTLLAGFRYVEFLDALGVHAENPALGYSRDITIDTTNRMYGIQIGAQMAIYRSDTWRFDGWIKAGGYGNLANNSTGVFSSGAPAQDSSIRAQGSHTSFVGDFGFRATRRFGEHVSAYVGYRLMYLDGVALASNQHGNALDYLNGSLPAIALSGSQLLQGIEAGFAFAF